MELPPWLLPVSKDITNLPDAFTLLTGTLGMSGDTCAAVQTCQASDSALQPHGGWSILVSHSATSQGC